MFIIHFSINIFYHQILKEIYPGDLQWDEAIYILYYISPTIV